MKALAAGPVPADDFADLLALDDAKLELLGEKSFQQGLHILVCLCV